MSNFNLPKWILPIAAIVTGLSAAISYIQDDQKSKQIDNLVETNKQLVETIRQKEQIL